MLSVGWLGAATLVGGLRCKVSPESAYKIEDNKPVVLKGTLRPLAMVLCQTHWVCLSTKTEHLLADGDLQPI